MSATARHDLPRTPPHAPSRQQTALARLVVVAVVGVAVGVVVAVAAPWYYGPLCGWITACALFLALTWRRTWPMDPEQTAQHAVREDTTRAGADVVLLLSAVASLTAVGVVMAKGSSDHGTRQAVDVVLTVAAIALAWAVVHTSYALRYARHYYTDQDGGIDFNQDEPPRYSDFAYLAFTLGMTFQVSDTDISSSTIRRAALKHALLSYLFGAVILATVVNLVSSLMR
jgi:uncharacterized membrane protein